MTLLTPCKVGGQFLELPTAPPTYPAWPTIPTSSQVITQTSQWTSSATATATRSAMGVSAGDIDGRNGSVLAPNGLIYSAPAAGQVKFLVINPTAGTAVAHNLGESFTDDQSLRGWYGGVLGSDGRLYFMPYNGANVLIVNPTDTTASPYGTATRTDYGLVNFDNPVDSKWYGGVMAGNGKIYGVPSEAPDVLVIDPATQTATRTDFGLGGFGLNAYHGGVLGRDGKIYCVPGGATTVLVIDPDTNTAVKTALGLGTLGSGSKWRGGVMGKDGKIYCLPSTATDFLIIDSVNGTATRSTLGLTLPGDTNAWWSGVLGADGRIYCTPRNTGQILVIDTDTQTASLQTFGANLAAPTTNRWGGGTLAPNGKIYCPPFAATDILCIDTHGTGTTVPDVLLSPTLNKY